MRAELNEFVVHNLSKEFRKTDSHISNVHEDLSRKIDKLQSIQLEASRYVSSPYAEQLIEAEDLLRSGKYMKAYDMFERYSRLEPNSAAGYVGMYRAITKDYTCNLLSEMYTPEKFKELCLREVE